MVVSILGGVLLLPDQLAGVKLFPCLPGDKLPALDYGWQSRATNDPGQLAAWDGAMPNLNWGVAAGPSGLFIIDVDPAALAAGSAWKTLLASTPELKSAIDRSFTVQTPRGGFHHYFRGNGPTTVGAIAEGVDTRGGYVDTNSGRMKSIGYVVAPGSKTVAGPKTVAGEYVALGGELFEMPEPVLRIVPEKKKGTVIGLERDPAKDQPRNIQWARDLLNSYVTEGRVSVEGNGGNNTAFQVAASILDKAISPALALDLLDEMWNPHCSPPWEEWELEKIVGNAARYGEDTGGGSKGFEDNQSAFSKFIGTESEQAEKAPERRTKVQWIDEYAEQVEDPVWLLPGILPAQGTAMLYGASGSYKSFIALDWASCLAHGHAGQWGAPPVTNDVLYFAGEAPIGTAKQRRPAWLNWRGVQTEHRLAIFPRVPHLSDKDGWAGVKEDIAEIGLQPRLIIIDTLARLLTGFDENSTKDATVATGFMEDLARYYECLVLAIHHTGKDENKGARGSSAFFANLDTVLWTKKTGAGTMLKVRKHKDADAPDEGIYLKVRQISQSIVLEKSEENPEDNAHANGAKTSWSEAGELAKRIQKLGGRVAHTLLCQDIAAELGIEALAVKRELRLREDIGWLKSGDFWQLPSGDLEFDL